MSTATTTTHTWSEYAILTSSKDPHVQWRVDVNETGTFRCSCPSFIYCRTNPKECKHTRWAVAERATQGILATSVAGRPIVAPYWDEAAAIVAAMLSRAGVKLGAVTRRTMTDVLAARLQTFVPAPITAKTPVASGVRRITFDD